MAAPKLDAELQYVMTALGATIRERRKAAGLSRAGLAERVSLPQRTMAAIESGRAQLTIQQLHTLAGVLGTSLVQLMASVNTSRESLQPGDAALRPGRAIRREQLAQMDERVLRRDVLLPLFRHMPFDHVAETHGGPLEQGKDFVLLSKSATGATLCTGVVVKAGAITGSAEFRSGTAATVIMQITQCLRRGWPHPASHVEIPVNHCWVIASGEIKKEAQNAIQSALDADLRARVEFTDGDKLYRLIEEHMGPSTALDLVEEAIRRIQGLVPDGHRVVAVAGADGALGMSLHAQPGVEKPDPIAFSLTLSQPNTPEGRAALQAAVDTIKYGGTLRADDGVLASFTPPAVFAALMPAGETLMPLLLESRRHPTAIPATIFALKDGQIVGSWDHVVMHLVVTGPSKISVTVKDSREALRLTIEQDGTDAQFAVGFANKEDTPWLVDAVRLHGAVEFLVGFAQADAMQVWDDRSEVMILEARGPFPGSGSLTNLPLREDVRLAALVQRFVGRTILIPREGFPEGQGAAVMRLGTLLDGRAEILPIRGAAINFAGGMEDARKMLAKLEKLERGEGPRAIVQHPETYLVLDPPVTVHVVDLLFDALLNHDSRTQLAAWAQHEPTGTAGEVEEHRKIVLRFEPAGNMRVQRYLAPDADGADEAHEADDGQSVEGD